MKKVVRFPIYPYLPNIGVNGKMMLRAPKFVKPRRKTLMSRPQNFDKPKRKWFRILWPIHQRNHEVNLLLVLTKKKNKKKNKNKNKNKKVPNLPEQKKIAKGNSLLMSIQRVTIQSLTTVYQRYFKFHLYFLFDMHHTIYNIV